MVSLLFIPSGNPDGFHRQAVEVRDSIGFPHELVVCLVATDPALIELERECNELGARYMVLPDFGYVTLLNILAARARGDYLVYIPPNMCVTGSNWAIKAVKSVSRGDRIGGGILSDKPSDGNCDGLFMTTKTMHILGYYAMPLFETPGLCMRWTASILTEAGRFASIGAGITYRERPLPPTYHRDYDLYMVTRSVRGTLAAKLRAFMEDENDERYPADN